MPFLALGLLIVSIALYLATGDGESIAGLPRETFVKVGGLLSMLIFLMAGFARANIGRASKAVAALGSWVAIGLVVLVLYAYRSELGEVGDRVVQELSPGSVRTLAPGVKGRGAVVLVRKAGEGHFVVKTRVNGQSVRMIVDTGASAVVLRPEDARRAGIRLNALDYTVPVDTANGRAFAARVKLDRVALGDLVIEKVDALVTKPGTLQQSLLGMSFLSRLHSYRFSGDQLEMRS